VPGLHFHDLRHTGNTLAAQTGVSLADLKARMGRDSVRAAMIYQHATSAADRRIADALDQVLGQPDASDQAKRRRPKSGGKRRRGMAR
jgi:integrase